MKLSGRLKNDPGKDKQKFRRTLKTQMADVQKVIEKQTWPVNEDSHCLLE